MKLHAATPTKPRPVAVHLDRGLILFDEGAAQAATVVESPEADAAEVSQTPEEEVQEWLDAVRLCFSVRGRWFEV